MAAAINITNFSLHNQLTPEYPMTEDEIREIIERETRAWDNQNLDMLMSIFHQDMVWPWPRTVHSHDPIDWFFEIGRFNYERWRKRWQKLF